MGQKDARLTDDSDAASEWLVEALQELGEVSRKKMFGGFGVFESAKMFALVTSDGEIFFKVSDANRARYEEIDAPKFGRMPYWAPPKTVLSDRASLNAWARESIAVAHAQ